MLNREGGWGWLCVQERNVLEGGRRGEYKQEQNRDKGTNRAGVRLELCIRDKKR